MQSRSTPGALPPSDWAVAITLGVWTEGGVRPGRTGGAALPPAGGDRGRFQFRSGARRSPAGAPALRAHQVQLRPGLREGQRAGAAALAARSCDGPKEKVRIVSPYIGGGFNGKGSILADAVAGGAGRAPGGAAGQTGPAAPPNVQQHHPPAGLSTSPPALSMRTVPANKGGASDCRPFFVDLDVCERSISNPAKVGN